jgi:hypothetical protein
MSIRSDISFVQSFVIKIVIMIISLYSWSGYTAELPLTCPDNPEKRFLEVQMGLTQAIIVDFNFSRSTFVPDNLFCEQWHDSVKNNKQYQEIKTFQYQTMISPKGQKHVHLLGQTKDIFYGLCKTSPLCDFNFPYFLTSWDTFKFKINRWRNQSQSMIKNTDPCNEPLVKKNKSTALKKLTPLPINSKDQVGLSLINSFNDHLLKIIKQNKTQTIFLTTLSLSNKLLADIQNELAKSANTILVIMFDILSQISDYEMISILKLKPKNLFVVPIYNTPERSRYFHLKTLVTTQGDYFFTSANLTNKESAVTLDLGFHGNEKDVSNELGTMLTDILIANCKNIKYLSCTENARWGYSQTDMKNVFTTQLNEACENINTFDLKSFTKPKNNYFVSSDEEDLTAFIVSEIEKSKHNINVFTHHFDQEEVWNALLKAYQRGVVIDILFGAPDFSIDFQIPENKNLFKIRKFNPYSFLQPHAKGLLIDDAKAIICTGNMTENGLNLSTEACMTINSEPAISAVSQYLIGASSYVYRELPINYKKLLINAEKLQNKVAFVFFPFGSIRSSAAWKQAQLLLDKVPELSEDYLQAKGSLSDCLLNNQRPSYLYNFIDVMDCLKITEEKDFKTIDN